MAAKNKKAVNACIEIASLLMVNELPLVRKRWVTLGDALTVLETKEKAKQLKKRDRKK